MDLDALVRRVDEDRWLASRFAPPKTRARLTALYALNYEIARTPETVREPQLGLMRLAWWREAIAEMHGGAPPREHPALAAYARALAETPFAAPLWDGLIDARAQDLEAAPFSTWSDLEVYVDATAGALAGMAMQACGAAPDGEFARAVGRAWALCGLLRAEPAWRERGRSPAPAEGGGLEEMRARAHDALARLRALPAPSETAFPAVGYAALIPGYLRRLSQDRRETAQLTRRFALVRAAATGRL